MPAITGDTANGRSISVRRTPLPRNWNRAITHAAAMPKPTLSGTAIAAAISVSRIAARVSGCARADR